MACTLHVAWDDRLAAYDFGAGHPMAPARVELTIDLARAFGLFAEAGVSVEPPVPATDAELELVHDPRYIAGVRRAGGPEPDPRCWISGSAPRMTRCSRACTTPRRWWRARPWRRPARCGPAWRSMERASRAGCGTRCAATRAGSACTTTRRSRSPGYCGRARSGSPTLTSTCTTATGCRPLSMTIRGC